MLLTVMLQASPAFYDLTPEQQEVKLRLAEAFQNVYVKEVTNSVTGRKEEEVLYPLDMSPQELTKHSGLGSAHHWQDFLNDRVVKSYIKNQMAFNSQVAARKALTALQREALHGNVQAARQINELSGVLNQTDNNRTVVLHRIDRPTLAATAANVATIDTPVFKDDPTVNTFHPITNRPIV